MKKLQVIVLVLILFGSATVRAQNEFDALRYSQIDVLGTARYAAMGGAFGALGGDMTTLSVNPAGIGVFNKTTASTTISVIGSDTEASFMGESTEDSRLNVNIANAGFVARFNRKKGNDKQWAWKAFHIGVAYNRMGHFHRRTSIVGVNTSNSLIDTWVNQLNNDGLDYSEISGDVVPGSEFTDSFLGWNTFLVDTIPGSTNSYLRNALPNYGQTQKLTEITKGSMKEVALSFGGNFGNALYFGATIGIPTINYELERTYSETDEQDSIADFSSFTKTDYLKVNGNGFNFKFGVVYRPVKWVRLGAAFHSPSFFEMDERYSTVVSSDMNNSQLSQSSLEGVYKYSFRTPFRAIGSFAFVIGKVGVISADYEYVNYTMAKFRASDYSFDTENASVKSKLHWAGNIRIGTEWRLKKLSLRGGFSINGDPYTGAYNFDNTKYSLGLGYRWKRFFTDLTYQLHRRIGTYELYDTALVPLAETVTLDHSVLLTGGFKF